MTNEPEFDKLMDSKAPESTKADLILNLSLNDSIQKKDDSREKWGKDIEFLMSCIALSVGLGNVWRFPFIALENGGGAFLIPYIIVLLLIGRPIYYMEVVIGQFSSRGCIKAFDMAPIMRGCAFGQIFSTLLATTYYACIMALTIKYLMLSVSSILPWSYCSEEFAPYCVDAAGTYNTFNSSNNSAILKQSSAELYFVKTVLNEKDNINDGIGLPKGDLVFCLFFAWCIIGTILFKGIRSSGKASYFLAVFPYLVMIILLVRAVTLPGSLNGIIYFLKPQWDQILNPKVWYAAITQLFFSLAICFGTLMMYSSYNKFNKNVYKDVIIITSIDSLTSILAGCIVFGILGNLAHELKIDNIKDVIQGGAGLAFISYPNAISKFTFCPQIFAVLFFAMLLVLGIGSNIGMASSVTTVIKDEFTKLPYWVLSLGISVFGFCAGLIYVTPGGQFLLNLVDFFGCTFIALVLAIGELVAVGWIYGIKRLCKDIEFMFGTKTGIYWRLCWGIVTPGLMTIVLIYTIIEYKPLTYKNIEYPAIAQMFGWTIFAIGTLQLPFWVVYCIWKQPGNSLTQKIKLSLQPATGWGPSEPKRYEEYMKFRAKHENNNHSLNLWEKFKDNLFG